MITKFIGAVLVIVGCGSCGLTIAGSHKRQVHTLHQLVYLLDYMECELQYHFTPLPELCRQTAAEAQGVLQKIFLSLALQLEDHITPDVSICMENVLAQHSDCPTQTMDVLRLLGHSVGRFDMEGQLKGLEHIRSECRRRLDALTKNIETRLRSYKTLGLCAGAALCILFI